MSNNFQLLRNALNWRITTKAYNAEKKISAKDFAEIRNLLRMSASSTNLQPWHFIIADSDAGKARINKAFEGTYHFNAPKVRDASHVVVYCARTEISDAYMNRVLDQEDADGRFAAPQHRLGTHDARSMFTGMHRDAGDLHHWNEKQAYLNMGNLLLGAAILGIDATPMEGVDLAALDKEFSLRENGLASFAVVSLGYRADSDFNAKLPKSRLPEKELMTFLD